MRVKTYPYLFKEITVYFLQDDETHLSPKKYTYNVCYDLRSCGRNRSVYSFDLRGIILYNVKAAYKDDYDNLSDYYSPMLVVEDRIVDPSAIDYSRKFLRDFYMGKKILDLRNGSQYAHYNKHDAIPVDCHDYDDNNDYTIKPKAFENLYTEIMNAVADGFVYEGFDDIYRCCKFVKNSEIICEMIVDEENQNYYIKTNDEYTERWELNCISKLDSNGKESNKMNVMKGMNFEFGPVGREIKLAVGGMAFRNNEGGYVTYDVDKNIITDVTDFTFDMNGMLYAMPVAMDQIKKNDVISHKGNYVIAIADFDKEKGNTIDVVNPITQTKETILPTQNIFGFNFVTKVVNFAAGMFDTTPNAENPFGNIMPMMLMSSMMSDNSDSNDFVKLMVMSQVMQNGNFFQSADENNPFSNIMPFMMMKSVMDNN